MMTLLSAQDYLSKKSTGCHTSQSHSLQTVCFTCKFHSTTTMFPIVHLTSVYSASAYNCTYHILMIQWRYNKSTKLHHYHILEHDAM